MFWQWFEMRDHECADPYIFLATREVSERPHLPTTLLG